MKSRYGAAAALALALVLALGAGAVSAHEERDAHGYALYVGFLVEPAVEGIKNGAFVSVTKPADDAGSGHGGGQAHGAGTAAGENWPRWPNFRRRARTDTGTGHRGGSGSQRKPARRRSTRAPWPTRRGCRNG